MSERKTPASEFNISETLTGLYRDVAQPKPPDLEKIGDYQLLEEIDEGGMGKVYRAIHSRLKKVVALKVTLSGVGKDGPELARFAREIEAIGPLKHPNVVAAYDAGEIEGRPYLVMELIDGVDLSKLITRGPLKIADACEIVRQAALGLQHIHEHGLVHRDIKPSNLILARSTAEAPITVKVLDLGLAHLSTKHRTSLTQTGAFLGTMLYMAPEQAESSHDVDIRADIYSLGCTLYELLSGAPPFPKTRYRSFSALLKAHLFETPASLVGSVSEISPSLDAAVLQMLEKLPAKRFSVPAQVSEVLSPFCIGHNLPLLLERPGESQLLSSPVQSVTVTSVAAGTTTTPIRTTARGSKRRWISFIAIAIVVGVGVFLFNLNRGPAVTGNGRVSSGSNPSASTNSSPSASTASPNVLTVWVFHGTTPGEMREFTDLKIQLRWCPAGTFYMRPPGSQLNTPGNKPVFVRLSQGFWLGQTEVTQIQWEGVMGTRPWSGKPNVKEGPYFPAVYVSHGLRSDGIVEKDSAVEFCRKLTASEQKAGHIPNNWVYRLPTEAEWEYGCRAGTETTYSFGDDVNQLPQYAWFYTTTEPYAQQVCSKFANPWLFCDMHGNVWEWCSDWYGSTLAGGVDPMASLDPTPPQYRVARGGSWRDRPEHCTSGMRASAFPTHRGDAHGFRLVLALQPE